MDSPVATCEEDTRDASVVSRHPSDVQSNNHVRYHYDRAAPYDYQGVMQGNPPPPEKRVSTGNFYSKPEFLRWALCHMRELLPTQRISRGTRDVNVLPAVPTDKIDSMLVSDVDGAKISAREFLRKTDTDSFLVIKDGQILTEQYFAGAQPDRPQYLFSASKSLASTMIGALLAQGWIDESADVATYVPELRNTGYQGATVRQLLDMTSGVEYMAPPGNPDGVRDKPFPELVERWAAFWNRHAECAGFLPRKAGEGDPQTEFEFLCSLMRVREHGASFFYKCADVRTLAWAAERKTGVRYADLFSDLVWSRIGAEYDAYVSCDPLSGGAFVSVGTAVTLRDFARVALMLLNEGRVGEEQVVPAKYIEDIQGHALDWKSLSADESYSPHHSRLPADLTHTREGLGYRSWFWTWSQGQFCAIGAFGQQFNVHPQGRVVVAKFSSLCSEDSRTTLRKDALQRIGMRDLTERIAAEC